MLPMFIEVPLLIICRGASADLLQLSMQPCRLYKCANWLFVLVAVMAGCGRKTLLS